VLHARKIGREKPNSLIFFDNTGTEGLSSSGSDFLPMSAYSELEPGLAGKDDAGVAAQVVSVFEEASHESWMSGGGPPRRVLGAGSTAG